jgi:hypothetical protein
MFGDEAMRARMLAAPTSTDLIALIGAWTS